MALETPLPEKDDSNLNDDLDQAEVVFTVLFTLEAVIKIIALGFITCGPNSYIRDIWNQLDFFIVIIRSVVAVIEVITAVLHCLLLCWVCWGRGAGGASVQTAG